jgi:hypothetical protein
MWILFLLLFLLLPLPLSVHAEDLGELSANPAGLSGWSGLSGLSGSFDRFAGPANKTDQIDQINEIDQFRLSVLAGLDQESLRRRESLQPQQSHEPLRPRPAN